MRSVCSAFLFLLLTCGTGYARAAAVDAQAGIATFNRALDSATRNMDNVATLALWENDGIYHAR